MSTNISVPDVDRSLMILPVGYTSGSIESLALDTASPAIFLSTFCLVQLMGLGTVLIPNPVYKFVSTLSDVVILYIVLGS